MTFNFKSTYKPSFWADNFPFPKVVSLQEYAAGLEFGTCRGFKTGRGSDEQVIALVRTCLTRYSSVSAGKNRFFPVLPGLEPSPGSTDVVYVSHLPYYLVQGPGQVADVHNPEIRVEPSRAHA